MGDDSYKAQPKFMTQEIIELMLLRIKSHCLENNLTKFLIIFHGGEPLLIGLDFYKNLIEKVDEIIPKSIEISYGMQTNAVLLTESWCLELKKLNINLGISLDGTPKSNNKNRIYHDGKGSYNDIINGLYYVKNIYGKEDSNCLCVIDTDESPTDVYNHFKQLEINSVHLLFQDFNYIKSNQSNVPKIGVWLSEIFDLWYHDNDPEKPEIRPLSDLIGLIIGLDKNSENFGKGVNDTLVIETDGSIETIDTLRICGNGFTKTKYNVLKNELSTIFEESKLAQLYYNAHENLCKICSNCPLESICGGGYLGHRYSNSNEFDNPSIYCKEIVEIICHIQNQLLKDIPTEAIKKSGVEALNFHEIINSINQYVF